MKSVELRDAASSEQAIREGQTEEVVVLQDGRPVALIVPFDADDLEWYTRERDPAFVESIARARAQVQSGQAVAHEQVKRQLGVD
jgi:antitoxin (DNA-binding transcriptional repressor) of toxin-antitoxin stability system